LMARYRWDGSSGCFIPSGFDPEQWDQLVRVAASLRDRVAPAHIMLLRLNSASFSALASASAPAKGE
jgi:hypothetical protein